MDTPCTRFTAAEGGARLAATAAEKNTLVVEYASFISTRLIYENAYKIRGSLIDGKQRSVFITRVTRVDVVAYELNILTDLAVGKAIKYTDVFDWHAELDKTEVLVCTSPVLKQILQDEIIDMTKINVLVIDSCHLISNDENLQYIMKQYKECEEDKRPRILALTYPLFSSPKNENNSTDDNKNKENLSKIDESEENSGESGENPSNSEKNVANNGETPSNSGENPPNTEENPLNNKEEQESIAKTADTVVNDLKSETIDLKTDSEAAEPENKDYRAKTQIDREEMGVYENLDDFAMYEKLEWKIEQLEKDLCCQMDLAEDIDGGKRLSANISKPKELIIEYGPQPSPEKLSEEYLDLENYMRTTVNDAVAFLNEHRYDPTEIYGDDLYEDFKNIPDPTIEPEDIFKQFIYVLDQLGPYAADKAAFSLLTKLEKLKIKVPYERHFLLLCLCTSVFVKIRCYAEIAFSKHASDWDKITHFSTPKVLRFAEILEKFNPPDANKDNSNTETKNELNNPKVSNNRTRDLLAAIEKCDFMSLSNKIEDKVNIIEGNLKELNLDCAQKGKEFENELDKNQKELDNLELERPNELENNELTKNETNFTGAQTDVTSPQTEATVPQPDINPQKPSVGFSRRTGHRTRGRGRAQRSNAARIQQLQQNPDALCGIVYMKEPLMAKIMFMLIVDMSRSRRSLSFVCAQYCAAEPLSAPAAAETQRQGRNTEDVLKKFRMHECNLLLATSALEEGIDLPRCNLVLRWDIPPSYRSYGLCRGRARAARAACALLASAAPHNTPRLLHNLAVYRELDQIISRKCGCGVQDEPPQSEEDHADSFTHIVKAYTPSEIASDPENNDNSVKVDINSEEVKINSVKNEINSAEDKNYSVKNEINSAENKNAVVENENNKQMNKNNIESVSKEIKDNNETNCDQNNSETPKSDNDNFDNKNVIKNDNSMCNKKRDSDSAECVCESETKNDNRGDNKDNGNRKGEKKSDETIASVDLSTAIALINRYCGKLPSDTFTRLAPQWWMEEVQLPIKNSNETRKAYICTLRLPLNCPVKYNIVGHPMPTRVLARRMVALQACRILHKSGELDNQLMPIGKENFKATELETTNMGDLNDINDSARPGTTKRRQYYYKRTASAFTDCQPVVDTSDSEIDPPKDVDKNLTETKTDVVKQPGKKRNMLYAIVSKLWCSLPERYNTRGRRLHAPQLATRAIGVLMARDEPIDLQIPAFPVYTRSGEVRVSVEYVPDADVRVSPRRGRTVRRFMRFVFAEVLRVRRRGMKLQSEGSTQNNYYIVPTIKTTREDGSTKIDIDWDFLELIYQHTEEKKQNDIERTNLWLHDEENTETLVDKKVKKDGVKKMVNPLLKEGEVFEFDAEKYREAVVTPWYRNQDQPQFFLVAEICWNLTPDSAFPSAVHTTFRQYYSVKYGVTLTQSNQPLLDVDHTSNRLNLLTPRYVNRKGVALPVSSERTRRAKRDRLDQKQILVPELCRVHPFAAPLWFATVALPCVLYRINALLIADEIRRAVAIDVGLGIPKIDDTTCPGFKWPPLHFGWSLAEVLSADSEKSEKSKKEEDDTKKEEKEEKEPDPQPEPPTTEKAERSLNDILSEEAEADGFEIGTWSNDMAASLPPPEPRLPPLPPNITFCTSASGGANWYDPVEKPKSQFQPSSKYSMADSDCSYMSSDFDTDDSDFNSEASDEDTDTSGFCSSKNSNAAMGVRIEYKTAHEAEAIDLERKKKVNPAPTADEEDDERDRQSYAAFVREGQAPEEFIQKFHQSVKNHKNEILRNGHLIEHDQPLQDILPEVTKTSHEKLTSTDNRKVGIENRDNSNTVDSPIEKVSENFEVMNVDKTDLERDDFKDLNSDNKDWERTRKTNSKIELTNSKSYKTTSALIGEIFPYGNSESETELLTNGQINLEAIEKNKRVLLAELKKSLPKEEIKKLNCFSMIDVDIDSPDYVNEKLVNVGFDSKDAYVEKVAKFRNPDDFKPYYLDGKVPSNEFDFDYQPDLEGHPGPSPSVILQALTMSNANDGINLERLETIGDSFLKFAITAYLYCAHPTVHEGKLSHMRSKQVSNLNLYRLGRNKRLGTRMTASKFEPHDNWLPPCHKPPHTLREATEPSQLSTEAPTDNNGCFIPYNLITQHSIPDKSIADCVEALIGAYLLECGPRGALLFMSWLGIRVLPAHRLPLPPDHPYPSTAAAQAASQKPKPPPTPRKYDVTDSDTDSCSSDEESWTRHEEPCEPDWSWRGRPLGSLRPERGEDGAWTQTVFGELKAPPSPLLRYISDPEGELERMLSGYECLERRLQYRFTDRALLLQALTHASHHHNTLTDCYQRLEFLGDAILDYLITRHLYEDPRRHSPGALTDLRSALVNNTIFATLAARHGFHKYFRHMSPGLNEVLTKYVKIQEENGHSISEEHYLIQEDEMEQAEDVEVPKALGDLFESVAGAIFLDSGMSLGAVWRSYVSLMGAELEAFSAAAPKSPVRELLEAEPDTAKFGKPERLADGRRVRVCVEVFGRGAFKGVGRNYRIAKGTAARCALRHLNIHRHR